ncbi:MAG TPA: hypothetical protein VGH44_03740 [Candidatus Saccharimonadia bacterium]|jgi:hypothetical protein
MFILLESYAGGSDFLFDASCTGRQLSLDEALDLELVSTDQLRRHRNSDWHSVWYEVSVDDVVTVLTGEGTFTFPVPGNPPVDLDRDFSKLGQFQLQYLKRATERS